ncbi:adenosylcobinamide-GDP ribazoletransferase [Palleronia rufa]|uniref:adenosylcobinamide-GDP ribazoletransferase n=1 Tax=Palleronia rufa TaxID=1530186 RepID=UPI00056BB12E|nr:adenosylcobinamide-GDP ribazoletransferase [Palleronia rufa]
MSRRDELRLAVTFLTRVPVGRIDPLPDMGSARWAFPLAGVLPGLAAWVAFAAVGGALGGALAVLAAVLVTGGLHHDGLADTADGLWSGRDRARMLEIMRNSTVGSWGVLALVLAVALPTLAMARAAPGLAAFLLIGVASRAAMLAVLQALPPVRPDGLGRSAAGRGGLWPGLAVTAMLAVWTGAAAFAALAAMALTALFLARVARARIGGQTGDVLGAVQVASEVAGWVTLATLAGSG